MCDNQLELTVVWWRSCIWCDHLSSPARQGMDAWPISSGFRLMMNTITRACARVFVCVSVCVCVCLCVCIKPHTNSIPGHSIGVPDTNYSFASLSHFIMLFWDFVKLHYHFIITRDGRYHIGKCGWLTEDDLRPSCDYICMVYDHPELGMIAYHPGMWMVHLTCILCVKFLLRMIVTILN